MQVTHVAIWLTVLLLSLYNQAAEGWCAQTCQGLEDGDYQSCHGCNVYASCANGILYDNRPCPAGLVWDENKKRCDWTSTTCGECGDCVKSCEGKADGFYQSCKGCSVYLACHNGATSDGEHCPEGLLWDDKAKKCQATSTTCFEFDCPEPPPDVEPCDCIKSCEGLVDGDYQSCESCYVYATCSNGILFDNRECPAGLLWDDNKKRCEWTSDTCGSDCDEEKPTECKCVEDCDGVADGDYQSCKGCHGFVSCSNMHTFEKNCSAGLVWDDFAKRCDYESASCGPECEGEGPGDICKCVKSCQQLRDGNYQSCQGCSLYATCSNGVLTDNQACPKGLVWDDKKKACSYVSSTCAPQCEPALRPCNCIRSCQGLPDGDYQSCMACNVYASCKSGQLTDGKACPAGLLWDNHVKSCLNVSHTCDDKCNGANPPPGGGSSESNESGGVSKSKSKESGGSSKSKGSGGSSKSKGSGGSSKSKGSGGSSKSKGSGGSSKSKGSGGSSKSKGSGGSSKSKGSGGSSKSKGSGGSSKSKGSGGSSKSKGSGGKSMSKESGGKSKGSKEGVAKGIGKGKGKGWR